MPNKNIAPVVINTPRLSPLSLAIRTAIIGAGLAHGAAHAATITVNSNTDNGAGCTLREAIVSANTSSNQGNGCAVGSNSGTDTIVFSNSLASNTITLSNGELDIGEGKDIEINASTITGGVTVDGNQLSRVVSTTSAILVLDSLTITGGEQLNGSGGGIYANQSTVTLNNATVSGNRAFNFGGGVYARNTALNVYDSAISSNATLGVNGGEGGVSEGGGIYAVYSQGGGGGGEYDSASLNSVVLSKSAISNTLSNEIAASTSLNTVALINSSVSNNSSDGTGGIFVRDIDELIVNNSTVSNNISSGEYASGGGINARNVNVSLDSSSVTGNSAYDDGGGLFLVSSGAVINNTSISGNSTNLRGGGIFAVSNGSDSITISNSTLSNNSSRLDGGGISSYSANITLNHTTLSGNLSASGAGISTGGYIDSLTINNSIIANSIDGTDCRNSGTTQDNLTIDAASIIEDGTCGANRSGDPALLPLADNGGPTQTHALAPNSIAIDTGEPSSCLSTDQRGFDRDTACDVGAFELTGADTSNQTTTFVIPIPNGKSVIFDL